MIVPKKREFLPAFRQEYPEICEELELLDERIAHLEFQNSSFQEECKRLDITLSNLKYNLEIANQKLRMRAPTRSALDAIGKKL